jgi:hypothetical protein
MAVIWMGTGRFGVAYDADAQAYITAVEAADAAAGQSGGLEVGVKDAINAFVVGCKADGIWSAIKASCILAGARTLDGCLVPLVGAAPTSYNFVAGDYSRKTGLVGDGSTKYLDSNRDNNADPQDSKHLSVFMTTHFTRNATRCAIGMGNGLQGGQSHLIALTDRRIPRLNWSTTPPTPNINDATALPGLEGASRANISSIDYLYNGVLTNYASDSSSPITGNILVFSRGSAGSPLSLADARIAFYSIGESLDLALLDARVTTLINAIAAAIP